MSGSLNLRRSRAARLAAAGVTVAAVTITYASRGDSAYAANPPTATVTVSPTDSWLSQLNEFTVTTDLNPDILNDTFDVEFPNPVKADDLGTLSPENNATFYGGTFPAKGAVCGTNTVTIIDTALNDAVVGQATITTECPAILISPNTVAFAKEPTAVRIEGIRFGFSAPGVVLIDGHQVMTFTTTSDALFAGDLPIKGLNCSPHTVTAETVPPGAVPSPSNSASAPLTITGCPPPPPPPPPLKPTLTADPDVVQKNQVTHVTGSGYAPNAPVVLSWKPSGGLGAVAGPTVMADAAGNIDTTVIVMLDDLYVPNDLVATQGAASASAPVLVQGGSMEPSSNDQLIFRE